MSRFVDLSHSLTNGMPVYPGLPAPVFGAVMDHDESRSHYAGKAEFYLGRLEAPCNLGTYLDAPFHRFRAGTDLGNIDINALAGLPGIVLDPPVGTDRAIHLEFETSDIRGRAVLVRTGWDERWGTDAYWEPGPFLGSSAVASLIEGGAALVGVDFWNVDDTDDLERPAHTRLLEANTLIVEHMCNLEALPTEGFRFFAPVLKMIGGASFSVRAFAELDE